AGPTGSAIDLVADTFTDVTGYPYVGASSSGPAAASPTSGAVNSVANALNDVFGTPYVGVSTSALPAAGPTGGAFTSVTDVDDDTDDGWSAPYVGGSGGGPAAASPTGRSRARSGAAGSGVAVSGGAAARGEPSPFDPGDRTNVLALLGMLDADPVAVGCVAAVAAGLPATPSCGQAAPGQGRAPESGGIGGWIGGLLALNGAESRALATMGAALVGIGAFLRLLRRRSARSLEIDAQPDLGTVAG
ncbi:MAG: hypothetical protein ACRDZ1_11535, partial [Acidimicrobiia bacterium]